MDWKRGRIWKVGNNVSHPCLVFIWGCKDIHRNLCYPSQPSPCVDSKSACISPCFLLYKTPSNTFIHLSVVHVKELRKKCRNIYFAFISVETWMILLMLAWDPFTPQDHAQSWISNGWDFLSDIVEWYMFSSLNLPLLKVCRLPGTKWRPVLYGNTFQIEKQASC